MLRTFLRAIDRRQHGKMGENFLRLLRAGSDSEMGGALFAAFVARESIRGLGVTSDQLPEDVLYCRVPLDQQARERASHALSALIRANKLVGHQPKSPFLDILSGGHTAWMMTMVGLIHPDLFHLSREIWQELARGAPLVHEAELGMLEMGFIPHPVLQDTTLPPLFVPGEVDRRC